MSSLAEIPLSKIHANPAALRQVNEKTEDFLNLVGSVRQRGVINAINVRELDDPENPGEKIYGLVDGLHRYTAAKIAGLESIPAKITSMSDAEVEEVQIIANVHKIETKPVEYSKAILRILARNPLMTEAELAQTLQRSPGWLKERLNLVKLHPDLQPMVNDGKMVLTNAYALAKLPLDEQLAFADRACTLQPPQFLPLANARAKEIKDAEKQGRSAGEAVFMPVAHMRKISEIKTEMEVGTLAELLVKKNQVSDPVEAFKLALKWAMNLDPDSVEAQRAADEARKKAKAEANEKAKAEREAKKQAKVQEQLATLTG